MKRAKRGLAVLLIISTMLFQTGCWSYREVDEIAIVAGVAIDKGIEKKYKLTVEIMHIEGGRDAKVMSRLIAVEGKSMFDAVRNVISESGQKLYWSHAKVIIVSQEIARNGMVKIIDWFNRDSEARLTIDILVSGDATASEILKGNSTSEDVKSVEIQKALENEKSTSKAPKIDILKFINDIEGQGIDPIAPLIYKNNKYGENIIKTEGTAIFKNDEFLGFVNGSDTKDMLFIQNKIKAGIITQIEPGKEGNCIVSLEIFDNSTKMEPVINNGKVEINIKTETEAAIAEIEGSEDFIKEEGRKKLEADTQEYLKERFTKIVEKVQTEFGVDVFGFGAKIKQEMPDLWDKLGSNWNETFKKLKVNVSTKVHIKNSAEISKTIERGE